MRLDGVRHQIGRAHLHACTASGTRETHTLCSLMVPARSGHQALAQGKPREYNSPHGRIGGRFSRATDEVPSVGQLSVPWGRRVFGFGVAAL